MKARRRFKRQGGRTTKKQRTSNQNRIRDLRDLAAVSKIVFTIFVQSVALAAGLVLVGAGVMRFAFLSG